MDSSVDGTLSIETGPAANEESISETYLDNRTAVEGGSTIDNTLLFCQAKHAGTSASTPTVQWIRNGELISTEMGLMSSLEITDFTVANAGVYQCIFIDDDTDAEIVTTIPYRLDTGECLLFSGSYWNVNKSYIIIIIVVDIYTMVSGVPRSTLIMERVSPEVIFLRPPEKLVIEVKASGRYEKLDWSINGTLQMNIMPSDYPNYNEILVRGVTDATAVGLYEVSFDVFTGLQSTQPGELDFIVIIPGNVQYLFNSLG